MLLLDTNFLIDLHDASDFEKVPGLKRLGYLR